MDVTENNIVDPTKLRQYFRVAICVPVTIAPASESAGDPSSRWSLTGETLDISGSGLLGLFSEQCQEQQAVKITLKLSSPEASVSCLGHIVHVRRVRRGKWQIALHFDDITAKQRDIIISNCLYEQRKLLMKGLQPNL